MCIAPSKFLADANVEQSDIHNFLRRRARARERARTAEKQFNDVQGEHSRIINDPYDSQFPSLVGKVERELEKMEIQLLQAQRERSFFECGDEGAHKLAKALKRNEFLTRLDLARNEIAEKGCKSVSALMARSSSLTLLNLSTNSIGQQGALFLNEALKRNRSLIGLNLHSCELQARGVELISDGVSQHPTLEKLNLRNNSMKARGAQYFAEKVIAMNKTLLEVDLSTNEIGLEGVSVIARYLESNSTLCRIVLEYNQLDRVLRRPENHSLLFGLRKERIKGVWMEWKYE